jgi:antitoxin component YwqK of YwqJK toxin-antitoxin module
MYYRTLFLCLLSITILANRALSLDGEIAQQDESKKINQKDKNGLKQGYWIYYGKDRPEAGIPPSGKVEEGPYEDDRKEGLWIKYHNDGETPRIKGTYINNRPQGFYQKMHPNGKLKEEGTFIRNTYRDSLKRFHENGVIEFSANYNENGREQGKVKYYYPNGQVEFEYTAVDGKPNGKATRYYENGDVKELIEYDAEGRVISSIQKEMVQPTVSVKDPGASKEKAPFVSRPRTKGAKFVPNGYNKCYNDNDEIWQDGEFRNGQLWDGKVYEYDADGILLKVKVFKQGVYHSDGQL